MKNKPKHTETGIKAEQIAANYLSKLGYRILHRNWRVNRYEIDIIAEDNNEIVFVEVKARNNTNFGFPEEFVGKKKRQAMINAAAIYMEENELNQLIRFDIIGIVMQNQQVLEIKHCTKGYTKDFYRFRN
jgi:putative endonuclease